jgi:hypothetical protein
VGGVKKMLQEWLPVLVKVLGFDKPEDKRIPLSTQEMLDIILAAQEYVEEHPTMEPALQFVLMQLRFAKLVIFFFGFFFEIFFPFDK